MIVDMGAIFISDDLVLLSTQCLSSWSLSFPFLCRKATVCRRVYSHLSSSCLGYVLFTLYPARPHQLQPAPGWPRPSFLSLSLFPSDARTVRGGALAPPPRGAHRLEGNFHQILDRSHIEDPVYDQDYT